MVSAVGNKSGNTLYIIIVQWETMAAMHPHTRSHTLSFKALNFRKMLSEVHRHSAMRLSGSEMQRGGLPREKG